MYQIQTLQQSLVQTPANRQVPARIRPQEGCLGNPVAKTKTLANGISRPAFLKHAHPPLLQENREELKKFKQLEKDFVASLINLCTLYHLVVPKLKGFFPMNVSLAFETVQSELKAKNKDLEIKIMQGENGKVLLASKKVFNTKMTLYYLPLSGVWELMKQQECKKETALLFSVLAYLYQVIGVPHFKDGYSYMESIYNYVEDWYSETGEEEEVDIEEQAFVCEHFSVLHHAGKILQMEMQDKKHLLRFRSRVQRFKPKDQAGEALHLCAKNALKLFRGFPNRSIMDDMAIPNADVDGEEGYIRAEQYISFYWSRKDCIIDQVMEYINNELNECSLMEEPTSVQLFDSPQNTEIHDHSFSERCFALLNEITDILDDLP
jgi:hypothetical protein